MTVKQN